MNARANKNKQVIRKKLADVGQSSAASALSVEESTISRMKSEGKLDQFANLLAALGLKVVPENYKCVNEDELNNILFLARRGMQAIKSADDLVFEDVE